MIKFPLIVEVSCKRDTGLYLGNSALRKEITQSKNQSTMLFEILRQP